MPIIDPSERYWRDGVSIMSGSPSMGGQRLFDADTPPHADDILKQLNRYEDVLAQARIVAKLFAGLAYLDRTQREAIARLGRAAERVR